jgi:hypothetical protein
MRLDATPGRGDLVKYTMSDNGKTVVTIVNDPNNIPGKALELKAWVEDSGGTASLPEAKPDGDR